MLRTVIPQGYAPCLNLYDTQKAIGLLKRLSEPRVGSRPVPTSGTRGPVKPGTVTQPGTGQAQIGIGPPASKRNGSTSRPDTQARCTVTQVEANTRNNVDRLSEPEPHYDFLNDAGSR